MGINELIDGIAEVITGLPRKWQGKDCGKRYLEPDKVQSMDLRKQRMKAGKK